MKNKILALLFSVAFLFTSCSNDEVETNTQSTKKTELQNTTNGDEFDELVDPGDTGGGWEDCTNSYTITGSCTQQGIFTGFFKFDDCKKYKVTFSHNGQTLTGLNVTLPTAANGVSYSFMSQNPYSWTYNASTQQFIITIPITKTQQFPTQNGGVTTTTTNFYKTLAINICSKTVSPS